MSASATLVPGFNPWRPSPPLYERLHYLPNRKIKEIILQSNDPEMAFFREYFKQGAPSHLAIKRVIYTYDSQKESDAEKYIKEAAAQAEPRLKSMKPNLWWAEHANHVFTGSSAVGVTILFPCQDFGFSGRPSFTDSMLIALQYPRGPLRLDCVLMREPYMILQQNEMDRVRSLPTMLEGYDAYYIPQRWHRVFIVSSPQQIVSTFKIELEPKDTTGDPEDEEVPFIADLHDFEAVFANVRAATLFSHEIGAVIASYVLSPHIEFFQAIKNNDAEKVRAFCEYQPLADIKQKGREHIVEYFLNMPAKASSPLPQYIDF